ncbi:hypothetical protein FACS1894166_06400 [Bacilli bacterium]|nr:hypothetical protein FACS1894166_06400 [Bacilli bacterium]
MYGENLDTISPLPTDPKDPNFANNNYSLPAIISATQVSDCYEQSFLGNYENNANSLGNILQTTFDATDINNYVDFDKVGTD